MVPEPAACPQCGFLGIPAGARYCPNCGKRAHQPAALAQTQIQVTQQVDNVQGGQVTGVKIGQLVGSLIIQADEEAQARHRRELRLLLEKVRRFWLDGVLAQTLQGAALVELEKQPAPDAVLGPWVDLPQAAQLAAAQKSSPAADLRIAQAFLELDQAILIVDGAGSGKTTTLLSLTDELSRQASSDPQAPVPVVLHLASWAQRPRPLSDWVLDEISLRYQIPRQTSQEWLQANQLALMLDSLDEVGDGVRADCIAAINAFRSENGLVPLAVCSRTTAYQASGLKLRLSGALALQPMTDAQLQTYLESCGEPAFGLRQAIQEDEQLRNEARNPAMLSVMRLAYQDISPEALGSEELDTPQERRQHAVSAFIQGRFDETGRPERYSRSQIEAWLVWLANHLRRSSQGMFLLEQLQPDWLATTWQQVLYWLGSRAAAGIWLGLAMGGTAEVAGTPEGRAGYVLAGLLSGLMLGAIDFTRWLQQKHSPQKPLSGQRLARLVAAMSGGALSGLAFWLVFGPLLKIGLEALRLAGGAALAFGFTAWVNYRKESNEDIRSAESLTWSWRQAIGGLPGGLLVGVIVGVVIGLFFSRGNELQSWLPFSLVYTVLVILVYSAVAGLRGRKVETNNYPNQGTRMSLGNGLRAGLLLGVLCGALYGLAYNLLPGAVVGLRVFSLAFLWYGGFEALKHYWLRLLLTARASAGGGRLPLRMVAFLEEAAALGLLQRVGGGYMFFNRLVQEYFERSEQQVS